MEQNDATFQKMGESDVPRPGPRRILICGYEKQAQANIEGLTAMMVEKLNLTAIPLAFATEEELPRKLLDVFEGPLPDGEKAAEMERAVIMSGLSEKEIHAFMGGFRTLQLPKPLWATLTPMSSEWTLGYLLNELSSERKALAEQASKKAAERQSSDSSNS